MTSPTPTQIAFVASAVLHGLLGIGATWSFTPTAPPAPTPPPITISLATLDLASTQPLSATQPVEIPPPSPIESPQEGSTKKAPTAKVVTPDLIDPQAPQITQRAALPPVKPEAPVTSPTPPPLLSARPESLLTQALRAPPLRPPVATPIPTPKNPDIAATPVAAQRPDPQDTGTQRSLKTLLKSLADRDPNLPMRNAPERRGSPSLHTQESGNPTSDVSPSSLATRTEPNQPRNGPSLTASDISALRTQYQRCWRILSRTSEAENFVVQVRITIGDGQVVKQAVVLDSPERPSRRYRSAVNQAMSAIMHPECNPLPIAADKLRSGDELILNFNPAKMFR